MLKCNVRGAGVHKGEGGHEGPAHKKLGARRVYEADAHDAHVNTRGCRCDQDGRANRRWHMMIHIMVIHGLAEVVCAATCLSAKCYEVMVAPHPMLWEPTLLFSPNWSEIACYS